LLFYIILFTILEVYLAGQWSSDKCDKLATPTVTRAFSVAGPVCWNSLLDFEVILTFLLIV